MVYVRSAWLGPFLVLVENVNLAVPELLAPQDFRTVLFARKTLFQ